MKAKSAILSELGKDTLIQIVPGLERAVLERGVVRAYAPGEEVARRGAKIENLIIPLSAGLRLAVDGVGTVGFLQRLRSLALRELLDRRPYPYSAITDKQLTALLIPAPEVAELIEATPNLAHYFRLITRSSGLRNFKTFLEDRRIPFSEILEVFAPIPEEQLEFQPGVELADSAPSLYFVRRGRALISGDSVPVPIELGEGSWFGGEAIVAPHIRTYTVTAADPLSVHAVRLKAIKPILERLELVDTLYEEPWLERDARARRGARTAKLTALPGRKLTSAEVEALGVDVDVDPAKLIVARSDEESIVASLCNVAAISGGAVNPGRIAAGADLSDRMTMLRLAEELESFGFMVRGKKLESAAELDREPPPALIWAGARLLAFLGTRGRELYFLDPAVGAVAWERSELEPIWDRTLLEVTRSAPPTPVEEKPRIGAAGAILFRHRRLLFNMAGLTLLGFVLTLLGPLFLQYILDDVLRIGSFDVVWGLIAGLVIVTVMRAGSALGSFSLANELAVRFDADLSLEFYRHALALPSRFYEKGRVGDIIVRLHEIQKIRAFFSSSTIGAAIGVVSLAAYCAVLFFFDSGVALTALAMVVVLAGIQVASRGMISRMHKSAFEAARKGTSLVAEMFAAITTVKASGAEDMLRGRWEAAFLHGVSTRRKVAQRVNDVQAAVNVLSSAGVALALYFACAAVLAGELSVGVIMAISMYLQAMLKPIQGVSAILAQMEETGVAFQKLEEVLNAAPEEPPSRAMVTHSVRLRGKIRLDRVSFRYSSSAPLVLKEISLTIYPNQVLAIVGRSGSGKSTLAGMIAGYVQPTAGRVFYDHYDASMLSVACLRRQVGFVQQGYSLFSGTLAENIALGDDDPDRQRIESSAEVAYCEYIKTLPRGFEHTLAARGLGLSGGQRQRLAIARAVYRSPNILIMDEAMSALDADSETAISENMKEMTKGRTSIIIAHRISTVRHADRIIVIDDGEIVEDGTHRSLLEKGGRYAELFEGQIESDPTLRDAR